MRRVDQSARGATESTPRHALLQIIRVRFRAFEARFGRLPKPDEPIFFDELVGRPLKASLPQAQAQLEQGAREARVDIHPVLRFLGLSPETANSSRRSIARTSARKPQPHSRLAQSSMRSRETSSGLDRFLADKGLHRRHRITDQELQSLSGVANLGEVASEGVFLKILEILRNNRDTPS